MDASAMGGPETSTPPGELSPGDQAILEAVARWIVGKGMAIPAILALEVHRPLSFVGSQAFMHLGSPVVGALEPLLQGMLGRGFTYESYRRFFEIVEDREHYELLIVEIERENQREKEREREEKARLRETKRKLRERKQELRRARREARSRGDA
jgi:hypothetical protein